MENFVFVDGALTVGRVGPALMDPLAKYSIKEAVCVDFGERWSSNPLFYVKHELKPFSLVLPEMSTEIALDLAVDHMTSLQEFLSDFAKRLFPFNENALNFMDKFISLSAITRRMIIVELINIATNQAKLLNFSSAYSVDFQTTLVFRLLDLYDEWFTQKFIEPGTLAFMPDSIELVEITSVSDGDLSCSCKGPRGYLRQMFSFELTSVYLYADCGTSFRDPTKNRLEKYLGLKEFLQNNLRWHFGRPHLDIDEYIDEYIEHVTRHLPYEIYPAVAKRLERLYLTSNKQSAEAEEVKERVDINETDFRKMEYEIEWEIEWERMTNEHVKPCNFVPKTNRQQETKLANPKLLHVAKIGFYDMPQMLFMMSEE